MFAGGAALGPVVGGWLLEHYWWGSVFFINVPIIAVFLVAAVLLLPESRDPRPGRIDVLSIVLSMTAMLPFVFGIKQAAEHGFSDPALLGFGVGIASGVLFVRRQHRLVDPLIDMTLFSDRVFSGAIVANLLSLMGTRASSTSQRSSSSSWSASPPCRRRPCCCRDCWSR